ncbi:MAG: ATP synthase F1 subunit delta [Moheibacter sp.]
MAGFRAAKRYAKGLMQFAVESGQTQQINQEMMDLQKAVQDSRELNQFLSSPILDSRKKVEVAKIIFKDFSPTTQNFIQLVINHGREKGLKEITKQYHYLYNQLNNVHKAEVITATELNDGLINEIVEKAKATIGNDYTYEIENKVDSSLIGGFILRVGDKQIDTSVKSKLFRLKKEFDKNEYIPKF